jgi:uncharacterized protein YjbJ (UPF0337 family)
MNKDQMKGSAKQAQGKVQSGVGKAIGSDEQRAKGAVKQGEGKLQKGLGDVREGAKELGRDIGSRRDRH